MKRLRSALPVLTAIVATWSLTTATGAQPGIPNGVFVQDSQGFIWLVLDGKRVNVGVWPASDQEIAGLPKSDRWAVLNDAGGIVAGDPPPWLEAGGDAPMSGQHPLGPALPNAALVTSTPTALPAPVEPPAPAVPPFTLTHQGLAFTILKIERPWIPRTTYGQSRQGREYITMDVRFDNGNSSATSFNTASIWLVTDDGVRWQSTLERAPYISFGDVLPGTPVRGWLTFEVPTRQRVIQLLWEVTRPTISVPLNL